MHHEKGPFRCPDDALGSHWVSSCLLRWGAQAPTSRGRGTMGSLQLYCGAQLADQETDLALPQGRRLARPYLLGDMQTPISATSIFLLTAQAKKVKFKEKLLSQTGWFRLLTAPQTPHQGVPMQKRSWPLNDNRPTTFPKCQ